MAFQFKCSECSAHIEVDDEYKDKKVTCPYCRKPTVATEMPLSAEQAGSAAMAMSGPQQGAGGVMLPQQERRQSALGWIALAVTIIGGAALLLNMYNYTKVFGGIDWRSMTPEEQAQTAQRLVEENPSIKILSLLGGCVAPVAAVVLSIITIAKKYVPRWPAIVSLVLVGLLMTLVCAGFMMRGMAAAQQAGAGGGTP